MSMASLPPAYPASGSLTPRAPQVARQISGPGSVMVGSAATLGQRVGSVTSLRSQLPPRPPPLSAPMPTPAVIFDRQTAQASSAALPDPQQIEAQRGAYMKSLDDQLKQGAEVLSQQLKQQQEYLLRMGDQQKRQYGLQVDQNIKHQELELVQQHNHQLLMLQQAAQQQKAALEQQANSLLTEYNQIKAAEDLAAQMSEFNAGAAEAHRKYEAEIKGLQQMQAMGAQQLAAQGEALARQANISNQQAIAAQQVASRTAASLTAPMPGHLTPRSSSYLHPMTASGFATPPPSYLPPVHPSFIAPPPSGVPTYGSFPGQGRSDAGTGHATPVATSGMLTPRQTAIALAAIRKP